MRLLLILLLMSSIYAKTVPVWFNNHFYQSENSTYFGYGSHENKDQAIAEAKQSIAAEISTKIESTLVQSSQRKGKEGSSQARALLKATSNAQLFDASVVQQSQMDGIWYVVVKYEQRSIEQRVKEALASAECDQAPHAYLEQTPLLKSINAELKCHHRLDLWRSNDLWYLKSGTFKAPLTDNEFDRLFASVYSSDLFLAIEPDKKLYENDVFSLKITAKKSGFLTLLTVYEDGKSGVMIKNQELTSASTFLFPSKDASEELVAGLVTPNQATKDLYVLIVSKTPIDTSRFEAIGNTLVSENEYKFAEIIDLLDKVSYTTLVVRTFPKVY